MYINALPEDILIRVFDCYSIPFFGPSVFDMQVDIWKPRLVLLSVCRKWRKLALPVVHRESFISYVQKSNDSRQIDNVSDDYDPEGPNQSNINEGNGDKAIKYIKSNLDILDSTSNAHWPRALQICTGPNNDPLVLYREIVQMLHTKRQIIDRVQKVRMYIDSSYGTEVVNSTDMAEASVLGKEFCQIVPSVKHLYYTSFISTSVAPSFLRSVVHGYARKLKSGEFPQWALEDVDALFPELTHASIHFSSGGMYRPTICADRLEALTLEGVSDGLVWSLFESESNAGILNFSTLSTLELYVNSGFRVDGNDRHIWLYPALEFDRNIFIPKIEKLTIQVCAHTLSIVSSIRGISVVKYVKITMDGSVIYISGLNLDKARVLFSSYAKGNHEPYKAVDTNLYLKDMLNIDGLAEYTRVDCLSDEITQVSQILDWKYLKGLKIRYRLKIMELTLLLSKLPMLEAIQVEMLELESDDGSIAGKLGAETVVEPIESSIKQISVGVVIGSPENGVANLKEFLRNLLPNSKVVVKVRSF